MKQPKLASNTRRGWRRQSAQQIPYIIEYCIPPDYETLHQVQKTGTYAYVRHCALLMAGSGNCIILDIRKN